MFSVNLSGVDTMEEILQSMVCGYGPKEAVNFVLSYCNVRAVRVLAQSVQEIPVELKNKLAERVIKDGEWHDAYYFLQLVRDIPESTKDRLLDKANIHNQHSRDILRKPIV